MVVKIHFETLSPGLNAKLDARYRATAENSHIETDNTSKKTRRSSYVSGWLTDAIKMPRNRLLNK